VTPHVRNDRDPGRGRQDRRLVSVTPDRTPDQCDKDLTSDDRDDRSIRRAVEPPYESAPAASTPPHATERAARLPTTHLAASARSTVPRRQGEDDRDTTSEPPDDPEAASEVWTVEPARRFGPTTDVETAGSILAFDGRKPMNRRQPEIPCQGSDERPKVSRRRVGVLGRGGRPPTPVAPHRGEIDGCLRRPSVVGDAALLIMLSGDAAALLVRSGSAGPGRAAFSGRGVAGRWVCGQLVGRLEVPLGCCWVGSNGQVPRNGTLLGHWRL
jgi:hypothetical protein